MAERLDRSANIDALSGMRSFNICQMFYQTVTLFSAVLCSAGSLGSSLTSPAGTCWNCSALVSWSVQRRHRVGESGVAAGFPLTDVDADGIFFTCSFHLILSQTGHVSER